MNFFGHASLSDRLTIFVRMSLGLFCGGALIVLGLPLITSPHAISVPLEMLLGLAAGFATALISKPVDNFAVYALVGIAFLHVLPSSFNAWTQAFALTVGILYTERFFELVKRGDPTADE
jgi:hypothetical protein